MTIYWEETNDYKSAQGEDSVTDNQLVIKEEDTTVTPQYNPPTDQPLFLSLLSPIPSLSTQAEISLTNPKHFLHAAESPFLYDSDTQLRHTKIKINESQRKQKDMHRDL